MTPSASVIWNAAQPCASAWRSRHPGEAFLVAPLQKFSTQARRRRAAPPKLVTLSNALIAVMSPALDDTAAFGQMVENACLAHAWSSGQQVSYWREEPLEVDAVLEGSWGRWAVEIKTGTFQLNELKGLLELTTRHPKLRPLVVCEEPMLTKLEEAGIEGQRWHDFLWSQPPR